MLNTGFEPILIEITEANKYVGNYEIKSMLKNPEQYLFNFFKQKNNNSIDFIVQNKVKGISITSKIKENYLEEKEDSYMKETSLTRILSDNSQFFKELLNKKRGIRTETITFENDVYHDCFIGRDLVEYILRYEKERGKDISRETIIKRCDLFFKYRGNSII
jgi:hypothetical protein